MTVTLPLMNVPPVMAEAAEAVSHDRTEARDTEASDTEASDTEASDTETSDTETSDTETSDTETGEVFPFGERLPSEPDASETLDDLEDPDTSTPAVSPVPAIEPLSEPTPAPTFQRKVETRIQLDLSDRRLSLYADDQLVGSYTVAVGKPGWETPIGDYSIMHMAIDPIWENPWTGELIYPGPNNPMGRAVIVFHTIGDDMIAFHGTPDEGLLGQAVSHGCVRMRNEDILAMYDIVRYGTPVSVVP
jgi:hypothetical protein